VDQLAAEAGRRLPLRAGQDGGELVAAQTADDRIRRDGVDLLGQPPGEADEQLVAPGVAAAVVDLLEPVGVDEQDRTARGQRRRAGSGGVGAVGQPAASPGWP
jgi:hypothetical protein